MTHEEKILGCLKVLDGRTDRQVREYFGIANATVNQECRLLEGKGIIERRKGEGGLIRNYLAKPKPQLRIVD